MARRTLVTVTLLGHLGKEPALRYTPSGTAVTSFSVAVNRPARSPEGEPREEVEWFSAVVFGKFAETAAEFLTKGSFVYVSGALQTRRWVDKAGAPHLVLEVVVRDLLMLGGGPRPPAEGEPVPTDLAAAGETVDDLPF
jgi:single-strand DNA-binding protein